MPPPIPPPMAPPLSLPPLPLEDDVELDELVADVAEADLVWEEVLDAEEELDAEEVLETGAFVTLK